MSKLSLEAIRRLIVTASEAVARQFEGSILAVFAEKKGVAEHIGTAFLYQWSDSSYLVTASHVVENANQVGKIYLLNKAGFYFSLESIKAKSYQPRKNAKVDYFVCKVNPAQSISQVSLSPLVADWVPDPCLAIGFPNSKNKKCLKPSSRRAKLTALKLHLYNINSQGIAVPPSTDSRYFGKWHEKRALDAHGSQVNSIFPRGMSGAPCFHIALPQADIANQEGFSPCVSLAGVLIEYEKQVVTFLRFSEIQRVVEFA